MGLVLSALDQSPVGEGTTGAEGLRNTICVAQACDRLGYHRYWVAEHHGMPAIASTSPEALIGRARRRRRRASGSAAAA